MNAKTDIDMEREELKNTPLEELEKICVGCDDFKCFGCAILYEKNFKKAHDLVAKERRRQVEKEGFTKDHDMFHARGVLAIAGACYATPGDKRQYVKRGDKLVPSMWPFEPEAWKPCPNDRVRELVKGIALQLAELERELP